jgi:HlyD family secretion protein
MHITRTQLLLAGGAVAVIAVSFIVMRPSPVAVDLGRVTRGPLIETVDADGRTRIHDRYVVTAPVAGRLERVTVRPGDAIAAGRIVARLTPLPIDAQTEAQARARVSAAEAALRETESHAAQARAAASQARRTAERSRVLEGAGAIAPEQREQAELALKTSDDALAGAEARVRAAAADVRGAQASLMAMEHAGNAAVLVVRSPVSGRVLRVPESSERVIPAGAPILELGDATALEVVADVLSSDAVKLKVGTDAWLEEWGGEGVLHGCVRQIEPSAATKLSALGVEEQRVNVVLDVTDAPPSLGDGYRVDARFIVWRGDSVLSVPSSAVFQHASGWSVFAVREGRARLQPVSVGHRSTGTVELIRGLAAGDVVVMFPSDQLADGARVRAR